MNTSEIKSAIELFAGCLASRLNEWKTRMGYTYFSKYETTITDGRKYAKVERVEVGNDGTKSTAQIVAFVDRFTGQIFKPATYKAPAKHSRGNVTSAAAGMEAIDAAGFVHYLA